MTDNCVCRTHPATPGLLKKTKKTSALGKIEILNQSHKGAPLILLDKWTPSVRTH